MNNLYSRRASLRAVGLAFAVRAACGGTSDEDVEAARAGEAMPSPNAQMKAVLDELAAFGAKPIETLTVAQARSQPTPADAVTSRLIKQGKSTAPETGGSVEDRLIPGPGGLIPIRIF